MTTDQILGALKSEPFRPFALRTASGQEFVQTHPELMVLSHGGRTLYFFERPDGAVILDVLIVESIRLLNGRSRRRKSA